MALIDIDIPMLKGLRIFYDVDGVFADFDKHFENIFHMPVPSDDDLMWKMIYDHGEFFSTMPLCEGSHDFFLDTKHLDPIFLTAASKSDYHRVARQKRQWVRTYLSEKHLILPVQGGTSKPLFMHYAGDVLIDDYKRNIRLWQEAGGKGILHRSFEDTRRQLAEYLAEHVKRENPVYV